MSNLTESQKDRLLARLFGNAEGQKALAILEKDFHVRERVWCADKEGIYHETPAQILEGMRWAFFRLEERLKRGRALMASSTHEADDEPKTNPTVTRDHDSDQPNQKRSGPTVTR